MSLHKTAKHLASKGRGPDTLLIHMAPSEVAGLQALAKAGGGSLTVNPDTGLPEAGFLEKLLPSVIGAGVAAFTGVDPWMIGAGIGGLTAASTGSMEQGLMAGLGAYGGAGLGQGVMNMGTNANTLAAQESAVAQGLSDTDRVAAIQSAAAPSMDSFSAGAKYAMDNPSDALTSMGGLKGVGKFGLAALAPTVGSLEPTTEMPGSTRSPGYIRTFRYDDQGRMVANEPVLASEWGSRKLASGGVVGFADGGIARDIYEQASQMAGVQPVQTITKMPGDKSPSDDAMDYLMGRTNTLGRGNAMNAPVQATTPTPAAEKSGADATAKPATPVPFANIGGDTGGGGGGDRYGGDGAATRDQSASGQYSLANSMGYNIGFNPQNAAMGSMFAGPLGGLAGLSISRDPLGQFAYQQLQAQEAREAAEAQAAQAAAREAAAFTSQPGYSAPTGYGPGDMGPPSSAMGFGGWGKSGDADRDIGGISDTGGGYGNTGGSEGGGLGGVGGEGTAGSNGPGDGTASDYAHGGLTAMAAGGLGSLGSYSDGGRLLRGPGDGVSDDIPATIGKGKHPARLADGEFVVPARIVSELGNGSTEAGARALYAMMDRIQKNRGRTTGKNRVAVDSKSSKYLPA